MEEIEKEYTEEDFMTAYIGDDVKNFEVIDKNWAAAALGEFIGPVWFFYRKAYLVGFAFIVLTFCFFIIAIALNIEKAYYFMGLIYLFTANKIYLWDVSRKVKKIINSNSNFSDRQLIGLLKKKGGTSSVAATLYVVIVVGLIIMLYVTIFSLFMKALSY